MGFWTIAGGVAGFALGGPLGAGIGAGIGSGLDSSEAATHAEDKQYQLQMAQMGAQNLQAQYMFSLGSMQIEAQKDIAFDKLETSLKIAKYDYMARMDEQQNQFRVDMRELDVREHEIELEHQQANSVSTADFLMA